MANIVANKAARTLSARTAVAAPAAPAKPAAPPAAPAAPAKPSRPGPAAPAAAPAASVAPAAPAAAPAPSVKAGELLAAIATLTARIEALEKGLKDAQKKAPQGPPAPFSPETLAEAHAPAPGDWREPYHLVTLRLYGAKMAKDGSVTADTGASPVDCLCWLPRDVDAELDGNGKAVFRGVKARSEGRLAVAYWTTEQGEIDPSGILFLTREDIATLWAD